MKEVRQINGLVKWFDQNKGFGFIVSDEGGADILLHANVLRNFGRNSVADQSRIVAWVHPTPRGFQASEIVEITPPATDGSPPIEDIAPEVVDQLESLPIQPARVKWFDRAKGFGFANVFGHPEDIFIHIEVLRHSGFSDMVIGEAIGLRVVEGPRGLIAAQVTSWDSATQTATIEEFPLPYHDDDDDDESSQWQGRRAAE